MERLGGQRVRMVFREDDDDGAFRPVGDPVLVEGCSIQPDRATESYGTGQQSRRSWRVFGPPELGQLRAQDSIDLEHVPGSGSWERAPLDGGPEAWPDEDGHPHHVELTAVLVAG